MIALAANTGQRGSDLVRMRWNDIEMVDGRPGINVTQQKTGLVIWVPFTQELMAAVATWERRPEFILLKEDGHPFTHQQLSDQWLRERDTVPRPCAIERSRAFCCTASAASPSCAYGALAPTQARSPIWSA